MKLIRKKDKNLKTEFENYLQKGLKKENFETIHG